MSCDSNWDFNVYAERTGSLLLVVKPNQLQQQQKAKIYSNNDNGSSNDNRKIEKVE